MSEHQGELSAEERLLVEPESHRQLRCRLEFEAYEATKMVEWYEKSIKEGDMSWPTIESFAGWTARLALVREKQERFGYAR